MDNLGPSQHKYMPFLMSTALGVLLVFSLFYLSGEISIVCCIIFFCLMLLLANYMHQKSDYYGLEIACHTHTEQPQILEKPSKKEMFRALRVHMVASSLCFLILCLLLYVLLCAVVYNYPEIFDNVISRLVENDQVATMSPPEEQLEVFLLQYYEKILLYMSIFLATLYGLGSCLAILVLFKVKAIGKFTTTNRRGYLV